MADAICMLATGIAHYIVVLGLSFIYLCVRFNTPHAQARLNPALYWNAECGLAYDAAFWTWLCVRKCGSFGGYIGNASIYNNWV